MTKEENVLEQLQRNFADIGKKWRELKREIGEFLVGAVDECSNSQFQFLQNWISKNYQISKSWQNACVKLVHEDLSPEVLEKIPPSTLNKIAPQNVPQLERNYIILDPNAGGPVKKKFKNMTPAEIRINVGVHGIRDISEMDAEIEKPIITCRATEHRIEGKNLVLFVKSLNKEVKYRITRQLADDINGAVANAA